MASIISFFVGLFSAIKILWAAWRQVAPTPSEKEDKARKEIDDKEKEFDKEGRGGSV